MSEQADAAPDEHRGSLGLAADGGWQVRFRRHLRHPRSGCGRR